MEICGERVGVGCREGLKHADVERLQRMSRIGGKYGKEDLVMFTVVDEIHSNIRSMPINNQESLLPTGLLLCTAIEHLYKPLEPYLII